MTDTSNICSFTLTDSNYALQLTEYKHAANVTFLEVCMVASTHLVEWPIIRMFIGEVF